MDGGWLTAPMRALFINDRAAKNTAPLSSGNSSMTSNSSSGVGGGVGGGLATEQYSVGGARGGSQPHRHRHRHHHHRHRRRYKQHPDALPGEDASLRQTVPLVKPVAPPSLPSPLLTAAPVVDQSDHQSSEIAHVDDLPDPRAVRLAMANYFGGSPDQSACDDRDPAASSFLRLVKLRRLAGSVSEEPKVTLYALVDDRRLHDGSTEAADGVNMDNHAVMDAVMDGRRSAGARRDPYAVKVVVKRGFSDWWLDRIARERIVHRRITEQALAQGQAWRVVPYLGCHVNDRLAAVAGPFVPNGDLRQAIRGRGRILPTTLTRWLRTAISTLQWLHAECRCVHGDTLTGNWLLATGHAGGPPPAFGAIGPPRALEPGAPIDELSEASLSSETADYWDELEPDHESDGNTSSGLAGADVARSEPIDIVDRNDTDQQDASDEGAGVEGSASGGSATTEDEDEEDEAGDESSFDSDADPALRWNDPDASALNNRSNVVLFDFDETWPLEEFVEPKNFDTLAQIDFANFLSDCQYELSGAGRVDLIPLVRSMSRAVLGTSRPGRLLRRLKSRIVGVKGREPRRLPMKFGKTAFI